MITKKYKAGDINIIAGKGGGDPLTRVDVLPEPSEEAYNENKIYDQNNNLSYIGKDIHTSIEQMKKSPVGDLAHKWSGPYNGDLRNNEYYVVKGDHTICKYNLDTNTVTKVITNSLIVNSSIAYCKENDKFYLPGGEKDGASILGEKQILCYDPSNNSISKVADMPEGWRYCNSICVNGYLYIFGGDRWNSGNTYNDKVYKMNVETNQIEKLSSSIPGNILNNSHLNLTLYNNNIYFVKDDKLYSLNISSEIFEEVINFKTSVGGNPAIEIQNNIGFVVGSGGKIFRVDLISKTFESVVMTVPSSSPNVEPANGSCIKDNVMYWFRFSYESKDYSCIFSIKNTSEIIYASKSVGGGGAEYEWVEIKFIINNKGNDKTFTIDCPPNFGDRCLMLSYGCFKAYSENEVVLNRTLKEDLELGQSNYYGSGISFNTRSANAYFLNNFVLNLSSGETKKRSDMQHTHDAQYDANTNKLKVYAEYGFNNERYYKCYLYALCKKE